MQCNNVRTWELNCYSQRTSLRNIKILPRWSLCLIYFGVVVQIVRMKKPRKALINIEAKWGTDLRGNCPGAEIYGHHRFPIYLECGRPWPPPSLESLLLHEGGWSVQKGGRSPPFLGKRGLPPIFWGAPAKVLIPKIQTEFSFGIGMVNTKKYRPIPTEKYRLGMQLYKIRLNFRPKKIRIFLDQI
jgi:hypothetical protein